ncbi:unnamed protein product [Caenorhabditis nigoni]
MSQPTSFADNAAKILIDNGVQDIHRKFTPECIFRADAGHLNVSLKVHELCGDSAQTPSSWKFKEYGFAVAYAAWRMNQPNGSDLQVSQHTYKPKTEVEPKPDETLIIRGQVEASVDLHPKLRYALTVKRGHLNVAVAMGFVVLMANPSTTFTQPPSPQTPRCAPSAYWPGSPFSSVPPLPRIPSTKRSASTDDCASTPKRAAPPVPRSIVSLMAASSIGQGPSSSAATAPVLPPPVQNPPVLSLTAPSARKPAPRSIKSNPRLTGFSQWKETFMYVNVRTGAKLNCDQLVKVLKEWGIVPVAVHYTEMFLGATPLKIFTFNVSCKKDEEKIREKMVKEEEWTRTYCLDNIVKNKPFFAELMQLGELFQTVLVATRLNKLDVQSWDRKEMVWSEAEVRKALRDDKVVKIEGLLNDKGKKLMAAYKKELLGP